MYEQLFSKIKASTSEYIKTERLYVHELLKRGANTHNGGFKSKCKKQETFFSFFYFMFFLYFIPSVNDGTIDKLDEKLSDHWMQLLILANVINKSQVLQYSISQ